MMDTTELPEEVESVDAVPRELRCIYESAPHGDYTRRLTPGGMQLKRVKESLKDGTNVEHSNQYCFQKNPTEIMHRDWLATIAAATPRERQALLKLAGAKKIIIKR